MKQRVFLLLGLVGAYFIFISTCWAGNVAGPPSIEEVIVISKSDSSSVPDDQSKLVRYGENVTLYATVKSENSYYLGYTGSRLPDRVKIRGKIYSIENGLLKRWKKDWEPLKINWFKIMPRPQPSYAPGEYKWYSNVITEGEFEGGWRGFDIIEYEQFPLSQEGWTCKPERKVGTVRFRAEVIYKGKVFSSPGKPDPDHPSGISAEDYDKGIKDTVHRISRLSNHPNPLIRYVEALKGVPWCWGVDYRDPPKNTPSRHQADLSNPVAIECSDLVISALRAMGNKNLVYTSAQDLVKGRYTLPVGKNEVYSLQRISLFKNWIPRGILWFDHKFYIFGNKKIQIRDETFLKLLREIKIEDSRYEIVDIALSKKGEIYSILQKDLDRIICLIREGKVEEIFKPEIEKRIKLKGTEYSCKISINPGSLDVDSGKFYLLESDTIHVFSIEGRYLSSISLEGLYENYIPTGPFSFKKGLFYVPVDNKRIVVYNAIGKLVKKLNMQEDFIQAIAVLEDRIAVLSLFPSRIQLYNLDGSFLWDYSDRWLNQQGKEVKIRIGSNKDDLQLGDLIITIDPSYHTLLLYEDNGNGFFDSKDKVICAGHKGVEIREASYFEGRKFVLRKLKPQIKISP